MHHQSQGTRQENLCYEPVLTRVTLSMILLQQFSLLKGGKKFKEQKTTKF